MATWEDLRANLRQNIIECQNKFRDKLTQTELGNLRNFFVKNNAISGDAFLDNYVQGKTFLENLSNQKKSSSMFGWLLECCTRRRRGPRIRI